MAYDFFPAGDRTFRADDIVNRLNGFGPNPDTVVAFSLDELRKHEQEFEILRTPIILVADLQSRQYVRFHSYISNDVRSICAWHATSSRLEIARFRLTTL